MLVSIRFNVKIYNRTFKKSQNEFIPDSLHVKVILANGLSSFAVLFGQEAIWQPEDAVLAFTFGNQNAQNQDQQDDGGCHSDQV